MEQRACLAVPGPLTVIRIAPSDAHPLSLEWSNCQETNERGMTMSWLFDTSLWDNVIQFVKSNAIIFSVVGSLAGLATWWINREVGKRTMARLTQDRQSSSDHHILNLCKALSDSKQSLQLAAAALLVDRARTTNIRGRPGSERVAILQALLAATIDDKRTSEQMPVSAELCKYIADSIVEIQNARDSTAQNRSSPLKHFYWQQVRLTNADWKDVDARGLDLFGANLDRASLRRAKLGGAILNRSSLKGTVLSGADLRDSDLRGADLNGADLRACDRTSKVIPTQLAGAKLHGANLTNAKLDGADLTLVEYDGDTTWPAGFDPKQSREPAPRNSRLPNTALVS